MNISERNSEGISSSAFGMTASTGRRFIVSYTSAVDKPVPSLSSCCWQPKRDQPIGGGQSREPPALRLRLPRPADQITVLDISPNVMESQAPSTTESISFQASLSTAECDNCQAAGAVDSVPPKTSGTKTGPSSRGYRVWSDEEERNLIAGVKAMGVGNWEAIRVNPAFQLRCGMVFTCRVL